jgi:agmatine deiminase
MRSIDTAALLVAACFGAAALPAAAQKAEPEPVMRPQYPEGAPIPRSLTPEEAEWIRLHPITAEADLRGPTPPEGPVYCPPEYAPMDGILFAWEGLTTWNTIQAQMIREITTGVPGGGAYARVYIVVDDVTEQNTVATQLANVGVNMSKVQFVVRPTDSIWIRDYGPRYIYMGQCRAVVDHTYNRPRPLDDILPQYFSGIKRHALFTIPLIHGGGNYHLDGLHRSYATELIVDENPTQTPEQIVQHWQDFQNLSTHIFPGFSTTVDATRHIDMWMQVCGDDKVVISDFISNGTPAQNEAAQICNNAAAFMADRGYTVTRIPARNIGGVHYTYTNVVMVNGLVLVPQYTQTTMQTHNAAALAAWQSTLPDHRIVGINCEALVSYAGVMHCIVMHVPAHLGEPAPGGGQVPTAYLRSLRSGERLTPGSNLQIRWLADDEEAVTGIDILLSTDGGETYDEVLASNIAHTQLGTFNWTVPDRFVRRGRIRVVARDADGNTGFDSSPMDFWILGGCTTDWDGSDAVNSSDISAFLSTWLQSVQAGTLEADFDGSGSVNSSDISAFLSAWLGQVGNPC